MLFQNYYGLLEQPKLVTVDQAEKWTHDFNSWDICDLCCGEVYCFTPFAHQKALEWTGREDEFVKRAGFALIARLAVRDKNANDAVFLKYLPVIRRESIDNRNYVRKAVNWALRQIGKRNLALNRAAITEANRIHKLNSKSAKWIASDALKELKSEYVMKKTRA
jgi:3-methyladenine DNA glycosylase AlkD